VDIEQEHVIERECTKVLMQSRRHGDMGEYEKYVALFTPDVVFKSGDKEPVVGREANIADMKANIGDLFMRCVINNILVTVIDGDHATATSYWQLYRHKQADLDSGKVTTAAPSAFCESEDTFVRLEEGWRISQRHFRRIL
jgi:hypothetical protein